MRGPTRVGVVLGRRAAGLAEEREPDAAGHVGAGHERADDAHDQHELVAAVVRRAGGRRRGSRPSTRSRRAAGCP